ncbi:MAG TPA: hypothetical protein VGL62_00005, partial [Vicinamibacterales bacterium]
IDYNSVFPSATAFGGQVTTSVPSASPFSSLAGQDNYRVTTAYSDINNTYDPGGRVGQLAFRINW